MTDSFWFKYREAKRRRLPLFDRDEAGEGVRCCPACREHAFQAVERISALQGSLGVEVRRCSRCSFTKSSLETRPRRLA